MTRRGCFGASNPGRHGNGRVTPDDHSPIARAGLRFRLVIGVGTDVCGDAEKIAKKRLIGQRPKANAKNAVSARLRALKRWDQQLAGAP